MRDEIFYYYRTERWHYNVGDAVAVSQKGPLFVPDEDGVIDFSRIVWLQKAGVSYGESYALYKFRIKRLKR